MNRTFTALVAALVSIVILPQLCATEADAKMLPLANLDHTRGQITIMIVLPAALTGALVFMVALSRHS
jgi:hypothetical protein